MVHMSVQLIFLFYHVQVKLLIKTKLQGKFLLFPTSQLVGFEEHIEQMVLQPRSFTNSASDFCVHPMIVASSLHIPLPSSSNLHVDVELSNTK
jgi:hypothetical protein